MGEEQVAFANTLDAKCSTFRPQPSLFDGMFRRSWISTTPYKGMYNLLIFLGTIGIGIDVAVIQSATPIQVNAYEKGYAINYQYFLSMLETIGWLAALWIATISYSLLAFVLQIMLLRGVQRNVIIVLQHITQSVMFAYCMIVVWKTNWVYSHYLFTGILLSIIFFKMHSYTVTNLEYHEKYIESLKKGIKPALNEYPNNITLKNYVEYLAMPTFVYKSSYPRSPTGFRVSYFLSKLCLALFLIVFFILSVLQIKIYLIFTEYVFPTISEFGHKSFLIMYLKLVLPLGIVFIMSLFVTFDCVCNLFAEITAFADRKFYDDFWNSCTVDEFFKKCNVLIPSFLKKYVYVVLLRKGVHKVIAKYVTLLLSSLLLEMIMVRFILSTPCSASYLGYQGFTQCSLF
eukprot:TRINITY_DN135223_c1_g1_i1.p2 TRINITY_DN135223_c1_g1~~TRINITY_DN135223_c1_g1_i1.p2  ORF type:complete len:437 (-),score=15.82 TRINITY_DN135223_c1_g1_i1:3389-4591(-)